MLYVATNSPTYHRLDDDDFEAANGSGGKALCGFEWKPGEASVVHERPGKKFKACAKCSAAAKRAGR